MSFHAMDAGFKRTFDLDHDDSNSGSEKKKKRRSRWGDTDSEKNILSGLPVVIPQGLTKEQEEQYLLQLQIEEMTRRLRSGELGIPSNPADRSPSPEPMYNQEGKRLNTREYRTRKKLEEERHNLIQRVQTSNPDYKPPTDYRPPLIRVSDRVSIPQEEHPEINFVGLLIGPRGNTLRNIEKETGTTIIIRGKGSVKEGKVGYKDGRPLPAQDEPLHAYITSSSAENVKKAVDKIKKIIVEGITVPDEENDLRKQQLRELALLNGTLRENDALSKLKQFQEAQTIVTNTILCIICGGAGHIAADCKQRRPGETLKTAIANAATVAPAFDRNQMDTEYLSLMAELGQGPGPQNHDSMSKSASTPALPMLGVSRPILALTGPTSQGQGHCPGGSNGGSRSDFSSQQQSPSMFSSRPPLSLPSPRMSSNCGFGSGGNSSNFSPASGGMRSLMSGGNSSCIRPLMSLSPVPPPSMNKGATSSAPPPWQHNHRPSPGTGNQPSSTLPSMLPPPPPPPFCSQPGPPPGPAPLPWQQPGLRPVPPPPPMNAAPMPTPPWCPAPPMSLGGVPPPPPSNYNAWQQPSSTATSSVSMATNSYTLPAGLTIPPPPPPPPN